MIFTESKQLDVLNGEIYKWAQTENPCQRKMKYDANDSYA